MAREPCSIIEALACHPSNVIVLRRDGTYTATHSVWHGFCVLQPEVADKFVNRYKASFDKVFVHAHFREYMVDYEDASEIRPCDYCGEQIQHLPAGYHT